MKKSAIIVSIVLAVNVLLSACNKTNPDSEMLASINIQNANTLFISSSNNGSAKLYGMQSSQLKSGEENEVFEIKYFNAAGEEITKSNPSDVYNLKNFVVLMFHLDYSFYETYLVRKTDGKTFLLPTDYMPIPADGVCPPFLDAQAFQEDGCNNLYYLRQKISAFDRDVCKVSLNSPSSLQIQTISAVNDYVSLFYADKEGNILYTRNAGEPMRYRKADGNFVLQNKNTGDPTTMLIWTGTDGQMYAIQSSNMSNFYLSKIQDGVFERIKNVSIAQPVVQQTFCVQGKLIYAQNGVLYNLANSDDYSEMPCAIMPTHVHNNELYNFDKNTFKLTHIDALTGATKLVFDLDESKLGNYDIDNIIHISTTGITFSATDLRNGNYVLAKISHDNAVEVKNTITGTIASIVSLN